MKEGRWEEIVKAINLNYFTKPKDLKSRLKEPLSTPYNEQQQDNDAPRGHHYEILQLLEQREDPKTFRE